MKLVLLGVVVALLCSGLTHAWELNVDCQLREWSSWGHCVFDFRYFGNYNDWRFVRIRNRAILFRNRGTGRPCPRRIETEECIPNFEPHTCDVSAWEQWSGCEGGFRERKRNVIGGDTLECPHLKEREVCEANIDCEVSEWSSWTTCTTSYVDDYVRVTSRSRTRRVTRHGSGSGRQCPVLIETEECAEPNNGNGNSNGNGEIPPTTLPETTTRLLAEIRRTTSKPRRKCRRSRKSSGSSGSSDSSSCSSDSDSDSDSDSGSKRRKYRRRGSDSSDSD
uniref:spondin-1-like n=1 Tax=Ciona intestinalis TaxID=7719 RepID=UPI000180C2C4|nr:spondin-1-like [Ciona intestinalis]|eukprot:XP_026693405.1 spondin-1-like [Ciona intestinalis]